MNIVIVAGNRIANRFVLGTLPVVCTVSSPVEVYHWLSCRRNLG